MGTIEGLAEADKQKLLESVSDIDRLMILILLDTKLGIEDLIGARVSDLNLLEGAIFLPSSKKKAQISLEALSELKKYLDHRPGQVYLFEGRCGKPITCKWKRCVLEKRIKDAQKTEPPV